MMEFSCMYLPAFLVWVWVAGGTNAASSCGICVEKENSLECVHSVSEGKYLMKILRGEEREVLELECESSSIRTLNFSSIKDCHFPYIEQVKISGCPLPNITFGEVFLQLGVYPDNVTSFGFFNRNEGQQLLENWHLEGLVNLMTLELVNNDFRALPVDLFVRTPNLKSIKVVSNVFGTLPESLFFNTPELETIHLENNGLENLPDVFFANLSRLTKVGLSKNSIIDVHLYFFADVLNLESLDLSYNHIPKFGKDVFRDLRSLKNLSLQGNVLNVLPEGIFSDLVSLENLDLGYNKLESLHSKSFDRLRKVKIINLQNNSLGELPDEIFRKCKFLERLSLSYNSLQTLNIDMFPRPDTSLRFVDLGHNNLSFTPKNSKILQHQLYEDHFPLSGQKELVELLLNDNRIDDIPAAFHRLFVDLKKIDLSGNAIEYVAFHSLRFLQNDVTLNLKDNNIKFIDFHDMYSIENDKELTLFLKGNHLVCDCRLYLFTRMVQGYPILGMGNLNIIVEDANEVTCHNQGYELQILPRVDTKFLTCDLPDKYCTKNCTCKWRRDDEMVIVNCAHQGLQELPNLTMVHNYSVTLNLQNNSLSNLKGLQDPQYENVVNLTVSNNKMSFINESDIPKTLKILDVRGNNFTTLPESLLEFLNNTDMILSFGENPWICDCDLINFMNFLHVHSRKVTDFEDIRCVDGSDSSLLDLTEYSICPFFMQPMVIVTIAAIAVFLLLFAVLGTVSFYKYNQGIKVWLFAHRMCLWAITEDEMDADKKYDAFISYSHKDEEFVNTVLVPGLESGDPKYRICLHYRDWIPGEYIQNQILQSVEASRRTIVVLSSNFIESVWGQLEFKAAHSQALQDRTNRIIVIVYGEVPPESELDEKLQLYISMKTYVKWGDAKFWEKIRYVMPHPPDLIKKKHRQRKDTDKLELVKSNSKGSV